MKTLTTATVFAVVLSSYAHAQCQSGGHPRPASAQPAGQIRWQPGPPRQWQGDLPTHRETRRCQTNRIAVPEPAVAEPERAVSVRVGQQITIDGRFFGSQPGAVHVQLGPMTVAAQIVRWTSTQAVVELPLIPLQEPTQARVIIRTAFGRVADLLDVRLLPPALPPQDAAPAPSARPRVSAGQTVTLDGRAFGLTPGRVQVVMGPLTLHARVQNWSDSAVQATLPVLAFTEPVPAKVQILASSGQVVDQVDVLFEPADHPAQQPTPARPAAPAFAQRL